MNTKILEKVRKGEPINLLGTSTARKPRPVTINGKTYDRSQVDYHPVTKSPRAKKVLYPKDEVCERCRCISCHCDDTSARCPYHCGCYHCDRVTRVPDGKRRDPSILGAELELNYIKSIQVWKTRQSTIQSDGSIANEGGEIITSAMTAKEHAQFWRSHARHLRWCYAHRHPKDPRQFDGHEFKSTHGLHVHMNWKGLHRSHDEAMERAAILCEFVIGLKPLLTHIGGREPNSYCSWHNCDFDGFMECLDECSNHGMAINANEKTVEFRIFRASTNWRTVVGRIELVDAIRMFCTEKHFDQDVLRGLGPREFYQWLKTNPRKWARVIHLAENEPC